MAALTWRNVDAPDFGRSLEGIRTFSELFGNATQGLERGLSQFDASQDKRLNAGVAMNILKYQDPKLAQAALASGEIFGGVGADRLSAATIQAAGSRVNDLLAQKLTGVQTDAAVYNQGRLLSRDAGRDGIRALLPELQTAQANGKWQEFAAAHSKELGGLSYEDANSLGDKALEREAGAVNIESARQGIKFGAQNQSMNLQRFGWDVADRATADEADRINADVVKNTGGDPNQALSYINGLKDINPKVYNALIGRYSAGGSTGGDGSAAGLATGAGVADPANVMNYQARAAGFARVPDSVKTFGDASDFALQVNKAGVDSSAMGTYQIVGQTMRGKNNQNGYAEKALGKDWRSQPWNQENQDKVAEAIFNDHKGSAAALRGQWTSIKTNEQAERIRNMPWSQARQYIAAGESGASAAQLQAARLGGAEAAQGSRIAAIGGTDADMVANVDPLVKKWAGATQYNESVPITAAALKKEPQFKGASDRYLQQAIEAIQAKAVAGKNGKPISTGVAAEILRNSTSNSKWNEFWSPFTGAPADGNAIDDKKVAAALETYRSGGYQKGQQRNQDVEVTRKADAAAQTLYDNARKSYEAALLKKQQGFNISLAPFETKMLAAAQAARVSNKAIRDDPSISLSLSAPQPPKPVAQTRPGRKVSPGTFNPSKDPILQNMSRNRGENMTEADRIRFFLGK